MYSHFQEKFILLDFDVFCLLGLDLFLFLGLLRRGLGLGTPPPGLADSAASGSLGDGVRRFLRAAPEQQWIKKNQVLIQMSSEMAC